MKSVSPSDSPTSVSLLGKLGGKVSCSGHKDLFRNDRFECYLQNPRKLQCLRLLVKKLLLQFLRSLGLRLWRLDAICERLRVTGRTGRAEMVREATRWIKWNGRQSGYDWLECWWYHFVAVGCALSGNIYIMLRALW